MFMYLKFDIQFFRQCLCIYRDQKNVERFALAIQCLTCICVSHLKNLRFTLEPPPSESDSYTNSGSDSSSTNCESNRSGNVIKHNEPLKEGESCHGEVSGNLAKHQAGTSHRRPSNRPGQFQNQLLKSNEQWTVEETERMLQYMAKVFMMQFPLYSGPKQAGQRSEEVGLYFCQSDSGGGQGFF